MFGGRNSWPAQPVRLPEARCQPRWNCFQRLCELLGFCGGAVACDRWLPKSRQHCTKKQYGRKESTSRLRVHVGAQQTSIEPLWGRQDIRGRQKGEWDAHRTLSHLVWWMQVLVVLSVFGCLMLPEIQLTASNFTCWNQTWHDMAQRASCKWPESRHNRPLALRFHPLRGAKWPSVQLDIVSSSLEAQWCWDDSTDLTDSDTTCYLLEQKITLFPLFLWSLDQPASTFQRVPGPTKKLSNFLELGSELQIKQVGSMHVLEDLNGAKHVGIIDCRWTTFDFGIDLMKAVASGSQVNESLTKSI